MLTLEEAQAALLGQVSPATGRENVPIEAALGRYVAAPVHALVDNPAFDNSAMDGYALRSTDLAAAGTPPTLPLAGESACGDKPGRLPPASAMRIFTGAPLPDGADTVVIQEDTVPGDQKVTLPVDVAPGRHIRRRGEDFSTNDILYNPGRRLGAYDLALLSSAGVAMVPVIPQPRALVLATGNELVPPGQPLGPGQIYESNRLATLVQLKTLGVAVHDGGTVPDNLEALREVLRQAAGYDFVISSGGASVGDHDLVKQVFTELGEINFWRVGIKPGKPVAFGRLGTRTHFFALPGNPVSNLVTFKLFVEPALIRWHHGHYAPAQFDAVAAGAYQRRPGRREFVRARLTIHAGTVHAEPLAGQGSHMLAPLRDTNSFIIVAEESSGFQHGDTVSVMPLSLEWETSD